MRKPQPRDKHVQGNHVETSGPKTIIGPPYNKTGASCIFRVQNDSGINGSGPRENLQDTLVFYHPKSMWMSGFSCPINSWIRSRGSSKILQNSTHSTRRFPSGSPMQKSTTSGAHPAHLLVSFGRLFLVGKRIFRATSWTIDLGLTNKKKLMWNQPEFEHGLMTIWPKRGKP